MSRVVVVLVFVCVCCCCVCINGRVFNHTHLRCCGRDSIATSSNLVNWTIVKNATGGDKLLIKVRKDSFDSQLVEGGPPPVQYVMLVPIYAGVLGTVFCSHAPCIAR